MKINYIKGFTLVETLIALAILGIMISVVVPSLSSFRDQQTLKNTTDDIISLLNQARAQTLSSYNSTYYGVHFETSRAVLFTGPTFVDGTSTNKVVNYDSSISTPVSGGINLSGGGANVLFTRLTGDTTQSGNIIIQLTSNTSLQKTITINATGVISTN